MFIAELCKRTDLCLTTAYTKHAGPGIDTASIDFANGYKRGGSAKNMFGAAIDVLHKF
jgi:hypothetical protein